MDNIIWINMIKYFIFKMNLLIYFCKIDKNGYMEKCLNDDIIWSRWVNHLYWK